MAYKLTIWAVFPNKATVFHAMGQKKEMDELIGMALSQAREFADEDGITLVKSRDPKKNEIIDFPANLYYRPAEAKVTASKDFTYLGKYLSKGGWGLGEA